MKGNAPYDMSTPAPNEAFGRLSFVSNNTSDPDSDDTVDPAGLASTIVRASAGVFTITLAERWANVDAIAQILDSTNNVDAKVTATVDGPAADNTITVQTEAGGVAADTTSKKIVVFVSLGL